VLIHSDWASAYGLSEADSRSTSRQTLPLARRLQQIVRADPRPFAVDGAAVDRSIVTCRDFALMLCGAAGRAILPISATAPFAAYGSFASM
jgi:hypothetical protein